MTIELNKKYKTRDGLPVRIYSIDNGGDCPVHGSCHENGIWHSESWSEIGVWSCCDKDPYRLDLVEIPPEPTYRPFLPEELPRIVGRRVRFGERTATVVWTEGTVAFIAGSGGIPAMDLSNSWQFLDYDSDGNEVVTPCGVMVKGGE